MTMIPDTGPPPGAPIFVRHGAAQVSYAPGDEAEVEFVVRGWRTACTAQEARHLIAALTEALSDPLAESRRVAARAAGMGGGRHGA